MSIVKEIFCQFLHFAWFRVVSTFSPFSPLLLFEFLNLKNIKKWNWKNEMNQMNYFMPCTTTIGNACRLYVLSFDCFDFWLRALLRATFFSYQLLVIKYQQRRHLWTLWICCEWSKIGKSNEHFLRFWRNYCWISMNFAWLTMT